MLTELQSLLTIIFLAIGSIGSIIYVAFSEGGQREKNKQTANDLEAAEDAKQRLEDSRNTPIDDKLDSLHKHG